MTHEIPQFYRKWVTKNLRIPVSPDFGYHTGQNYAYLIMGGPKDAPGNLFISIFRNPGREEKRKQPEYLKMHRIQASEVVADHLGNLLETLKKAR
jgi:hypothetical protein